MKAFEIYSFQPDGWPEPHPCVIVSHPDRVGRKPEVDLIVGSTRRTQRGPEGHEVLLDSADGLDWPTLFKCDLIYTTAKASLGAKRGDVAKERRSGLVRRIIEAHGWPDVL